ncbi:hypothetical protein ACVGVM_27335 [Pseudonocardia bannensis]|uniref:Uncharacterized protein n=1 Tax=Pseudonocardia bannensis TaxID=630973 RepID=A0A848DFD0_9PSEU|nr:hypothetical protein [Pseudonocardia bannensis]NMH91352.1 hypothetical protein [Pseudonocardia bannensis]
MLNVGPSSSVDDDAHLITFVDRLADAGGDARTTTARKQIQKSIEAGEAPAGLRRLAEALAAVGDGPPPQRRPVDDPASVVAAVRGDNLVVLDEFDPEAVAAAVTALLADGRRVVVTAADRAELIALRDVLPAQIYGHCLDRLPPLSPAEVRQLRRLLATATPARRARSGQQLPAPESLPSVDEIAELCHRARRARTGGGGPADLIPGLLAGIEAERRDAVTSVARCVDRSLGALRPREDRAWAWSLLSDLVYSRHRAAFERLVEDTAQATMAAERARTSPPISVVGPLPTGAGEMLRRYLAFLQSGGRSRAYFRSAAQRDVQPALRQIRVGGVVPETIQQVQAAVEHVDLAERLTRIDAACHEVGIPAPRNADELAELADGLTRIGAAARSVGALRHDVLFIHPNSPIAVPDLTAAEQIATAIIDLADHGSPAEAHQRLDRLADDLAGQAPVAATAPEHDSAVIALRERDPAAYAAALDALFAARRDVLDQQSCTALLDRLRQHAPRLADAWAAESESGASGFGLAWFVEVDRLLEALPAPDSADVVMVLGAGELGVDRLLLAAVAPRLIAVVGSGARPAGGAPLLSVLQRAAALVIRGRAAAQGSDARVVRLPSGPAGSRSVGVADRGQVKQAGA